MDYTPIDQQSEVPTSLKINDIAFDAYRLSTQLEGESQHDRCTVVRFATCSDAAIDLLDDAFVERIQLALEVPNIARHKVLVRELTRVDGFDFATLVLWPV